MIKLVKKRLYGLEEIMAVQNYTHYSSMIDSNVKKLKLGKIQSKRYFESFAIIRNLSSRDLPQGLYELKGFHDASNLIKKYERK